jgi:hypothetical protein
MRRIGPALQKALVRGRGFTSFSNCFFSNWNKKAAGSRHIVAAECAGATGWLDSLGCRLCGARVPHGHP